MPEVIIEPTPQPLSFAEFKSAYNDSGPAQKADEVEEKAIETKTAEPDLVADPVVDEEVATDDELKAATENPEVQPEKKHARGWQKRVDKLTQEKRALGEQLAAALQGKQGTASREEVVEPVEPTFEECENFQDFIDKTKAFAMKKGELESQRAIQVKAEADRNDAAVKNWEARKSEAQAELGKDDLKSFVQLYGRDYQGVVATLVKHPVGAFIDSYLAENPVEVAKLKDMDPIDQILAIARIGSTLEAEREQRKSAASKAEAVEKQKLQPSKAPPPAKLLQAGNPQIAEPTLDGSLAAFKKVYLKATAAA